MVLHVDRKSLSQSDELKINAGLLRASGLFFFLHGDAVDQQPSMAASWAMLSPHDDWSGLLCRGQYYKTYLPIA